MGGGAVLVESLLSGRPSIGVDVNPLGVMIAQAKTTHIEAKAIAAAGEKILSAARSGAGQLPLIPPNVAFWITPDSLPAIGVLSHAVSRLAKDDVGILMRVLLSGAIRDTMTTYRGEVRLRKLQGRDLERFRPDPIAAFQRRLAAAVERVSALPLKPRPVVVEGDIRTVDMRVGAAYGVVTSPPYGDDKPAVSTAASGLQCAYRETVSGSTDGAPARRRSPVSEKRAWRGPSERAHRHRPAGYRFQRHSSRHSGIPRRGDGNASI